jgi:hypothetical protein
MHCKYISGITLHLQTQGKIECYCRSMKNIVKLDNYFSPGKPKVKKEFVTYCNTERYEESL